MFTGAVLEIDIYDSVCTLKICDILYRNFMNLLVKGKLIEYVSFVDSLAGFLEVTGKKTLI